MPRVRPFSDVVSPSEVGTGLVVARQIKTSLNFQVSPAGVPDPTRYGYLFPELQSDPTAILPQSPETVLALKELGRTMSEPNNNSAFDSVIPSAYTYFGQFVDHDITLMDLPGRINLFDPNLVPLSSGDIAKISNIRTPTLDLDCVYGEAPHIGDDLLKVGVVEMAGRRPPGKVGNEFDVPRTGRSPDHAWDRVARIGDRRNTENAILTQLHVAFLRAHNANIVESGYSYCAARSVLRQYYQWVVIHDFLKRIADPMIVAEMLSNPWQDYNPSAEEFFMPLEFTVAAFRFGHSMVRTSYNFNQLFPASFASLFTLFNVVGGYPTLPEEWIIEWGNFVEGGTNKARQIDTQLAKPLSTLPNSGFSSADEINLAIIDLLRGYQLRLPTGQAVARTLKLNVMTDTDIEGVAASQAQRDVLQASGFSKNTPLWFYILAEAAHFQKGQRLGPVGSTLVAGSLVALIRRSPDSILNIPGWTPAAGATFDLTDLLRLAGVL